MFLRTNHIQLLPRNEGKLKSYDSCTDIRAWSHDGTVQNCYLREWIKHDMPVYVVPIKAVTSLLRTMTCKSRRNVTPRCHPDCKSKMILESICSSCQAMTESLKGKDHLEKYFAEHELETSHWPCDKCLDALKNIKLFWKIIIDKILKINIFRCEGVDTDSDTCDNVKSVVQVWQNDMLKSALAVKNIKEDNLSISKSSTKHARQPYQDSATQDKVCSRKCKKINKTTNTETKTGQCVSCSFNEENKTIRDYQKNMEVLKNTCSTQNEEIERLRKENTSLKRELDSVYKVENWWTSFKCTDNLENKIELPVPFEDGVSTTKPESEIFITMKDGKNEQFKHVSLLQVFHKTNEPLLDSTIKGSNNKKDDPLDILTKVQNRFGMFVQKELGIVNEVRCNSIKGDAFSGSMIHKIAASKSTSSCASLSSTVYKDVN